MTDEPNGAPAKAFNDDYSCTVTIHNQTSQTLTLLNKKDYHGYWSEGPPDSIDGQSTTEVKIKDSFGFLRYKHPNGAEICMTFSCPTHGDNIARITVEGSGYVAVRVDPEHISAGGHPVYADFYVG